MLEGAFQTTHGNPTVTGLCVEKGMRTDELAERLLPPHNPKRHDEYFENTQ